jgi:hypothetical protein
MPRSRVSRFRDGIVGLLLAAVFLFFFRLSPLFFPFLLSPLGATLCIGIALIAATPASGSLVVRSNFDRRISYWVVRFMVLMFVAYPLFNFAICALPVAYTAAAGVATSFDTVVDEKGLTRQFVAFKESKPFYDWNPTVDKGTWKAMRPGDTLIVRGKKTGLGFFIADIRLKPSA